MIFALLVCRARSFHYSRGPPHAIKVTLRRLKPTLTARVPPLLMRPRRALRWLAVLSFLSGGVSRGAFLFWSWSRLSSFRLPLAFRLRVRSFLLFRSFCRRSFPVAFSVRPCLVAFFCRPVSFGRRLLCRPSFLPALACFPSVRSRRLSFSRLSRCSLLRLLPFLCSLRRCSWSASFSPAVRSFSSSFRPCFPSLGRFFFSLTETVLRVPTCELIFFFIFIFIKLERYQLMERRGGPVPSMKRYRKLQR